MKMCVIMSNGQVFMPHLIKAQLTAAFPLAYLLIIVNTVEVVVVVGGLQ